MKDALKSLQKHDVFHRKARVYIEWAAVIQIPFKSDQNNILSFNGAVTYIQHGLIITDYFKRDNTLTMIRLH